MWGAAAVWPPVNYPVRWAGAPVSGAGGRGEEHGLWELPDGLMVWGIGLMAPFRSLLLKIWSRVSSIMSPGS